MQHAFGISDPGFMLSRITVHGVSLPRAWCQPGLLLAVTCPPWCSPPALLLCRHYGDGVSSTSPTKCFTGGESAQVKLFSVEVKIRKWS